MLIAEPGQQRRLGDVRLLQRRAATGWARRPASQVRRRRPDRGGRQRSWPNSASRTSRSSTAAAARSPCCPGSARVSSTTRDPQTLINLGSAVVQPPPSWARAVWAMPSPPAATSCGSTLTIRAGAQRGVLGPASGGRTGLSSGQVVVALANGVVDILGPQGNGLNVESQLLADGGTPRCPAQSRWWPGPTATSTYWSAARARTTFRFSLSAVCRFGGVTPPPGGASLPTQTFQSPAASPAARRLDGERDRDECLRDRGEREHSASTSSGALSATATSAVGIVPRRFLVAQ